jgi:hypothetical protein
MDKKGMEMEYLAWLVIALFVLVLFLLVLFVLYPRTMGIIDYIKQMIWRR